MKIGVYVGSFNPPHKGHIKIVNHLINNKYVDKILIIPTNNYWNKTNLIDLNHRLNMLKTFENNNIIINNTLNNLEYTYQIINELKKDNNEYSLIIGSDNIIDFNKWKNYEELLKLEILIINRNNIDTKYYLDKLNKKDKYKIINIKNIDISSTYIRENINNKNKLKNIIDEQVLEYIKKENLYS
jgi:nicotinate-nucleotide adenylyltransferase